MTGESHPGLHTGLVSPARDCILSTNPECTVNGEIKNLQENDRPNKAYPTEYTLIESLLGGVDAAMIEPLPDSCQCGVEHLGPQKLSTDFILQCVQCAYFRVQCCN